MAEVWVYIKNRHGVITGVTEDRAKEMCAKRGASMSDAEQYFIQNNPVYKATSPQILTLRERVEQSKQTHGIRGKRVKRIIL